MRRWILAASLLATLFGGADGALAVSNREERDAIRAMPLPERPNRPGHIYGNTVRRAQSARTVRTSR